MTDLQIFKKAPQEASADELKSYLDEACGGDATLRSRVEALFQADAKAGGFMERPAMEGVPTVLGSPVREGPGTQIGRYKLLQEIGAGGFGVVYMAEQKEPVKRRVALKIIKIGMDTQQVVARFEAERQALAMMDHPNIAKVLDGGATDTGRPYFVMELVKGVRITEYCDDSQMTTRERLELFISVCQAIQHAHQKGIIHRDIKPSNVMVTLHDGVPVPKVIDFGIAKATQHELTEKTIFTQYGQFIGTPAYMSPEQAEMSGLDIDTRSDIYSLGVLLYELLVGRPPLDAKELMSGGFDEIRRRIKEEQPAKPSTCLRTLEGAEKTTTARHRKLRPEQLSSELRGDLDWIVLKALEKDRTRRYETANGLAADLKRHLNNEPVVARPPSTIYRLQKAWRRNKLAFAAGATVVAALVVGLTVSSWQMIVARRAQKNETAHRTKAEVSEKRAQASARDATASLYDSLLGQACATRIARQVGYRDEVFALLRKARDLDTPAKQLAALRLEAVASMGDFVGFRPRQIVSAPATNLFEKMQLSPDGRLLALRDSSGGIQLHELPSGREVGRWRLEHPVRELAFSGAGDRLVTIGWSWVPGGIAQSVAGARVTEFALSLAGKWQQAASRQMPGAFKCVTIKNSACVVVGDNWPIRQIDLVEAGSWRTVHSLQCSGGSWKPVVAASRDGQMLALFGNADAGRPEPQVEIWDLPREQLLRRLPHSEGSLAFSEDGRYLLSESVQGTRIYETTSFSIVDEFSGFGGACNFASFLPGTPLVTVSRPQQRRTLIRDHQKRETVAVFEEAVQSYVAAIAPGGEFLVTLNSSGVNLYPLASADESLTLAGHRVSVPGIAFSPDGTRLASVSKDRTVRMWDASSGQRIWEGDRPLPSPGQTVGISPDGRLLATGAFGTPLIQLWDAESGHHLLQLTNAPGIWSLLFVPDPRQGLLLVCGSVRGVCVWHIESTRAVLDGGEGAVRWIGCRSPGVNMGAGLVAAPDGKRIVFHSFSDTPALNLTTIQDPLGEQPPLTLAPPDSTKSVQSLSFTPDGQSVAVLTAENRVAVFDAATGEQRRDFAVTGSSPFERQLVLSPAGRWLAVTSPSMRGVDIYDFTTGELRYTLPDREGTVYWLAWSPKEPRLAIARDNGDIALWDLAKIDRQLAELGLGFATETADARPIKDKP